MQKDVHFYVTYAIARRIGIAVEAAERIAWADQFTDELTESDLHGIQTQSAILGNWEDPQIQMSVLAPFHFVPGDDDENPWKTTADSTQAKDLVDAALEDGGDLRLGIALHCYQDTFSHQGFSGWREELNSCYPWYSPVSSLPNVGHAEMRATPDIVSAVWTDPRTGETIVNKERVMLAARATYRTLERWHRPHDPRERWIDVKNHLRPIFNLADYDERKRALAELGGDADLRYTAVARGFDGLLRGSFIAAAAGHLAEAVARFPWSPIAVENVEARGRFVPFSVAVSPNPFRDLLRISVAGADGPAELAIRNRMNQEVARFDGHTAVWTPAGNVPPGVYRVKVTVGGRELTKMVSYER
jgi:hypothetical protein